MYYTGIALVFMLEVFQVTSRDLTSYVLTMNDQYTLPAVSTSLSSVD